MTSVARRISHWLENHARKFGYRITWAPQIVVDRPETELHFDLEFVLAHLMLQQKDIFFIQIGANDGISSDPLYRFVTEFGWHGVLVEPMPGAFRALQRNHAGNEKLTLINAAVSEKDGIRPLYTVRMGDDRAERADMYSSFDRNVVLRNSRFIPDIAERIQEVPVQCISFDTLLERVGSRRVDVLVIDTEGFDYQILKMIDFSRLQPAIICYEHAHLDRGDMQAAAQLLAEQGYRMTRDNLDTIGYRQPFSFSWKETGLGN